MDALIGNLVLGLGVALSPENLLLCLVGALVGTLIGVLPGVGPVAAVSMLLPITFYLSPIGGLIMLAGIFYGSQYGGSTTSILVNLPGEASSVVTCLDGHQMALQGRAGQALAIAAIGSFVAGTLTTVLIAVAAPPLAALARQFTAPDYFSLMVLGLVAALVLASGSVIKASAMIGLGLLLGTVGLDADGGHFRMTFGLNELADGIGFVPLSMGLFGLAEIIRNLHGADAARGTVIPVTRLMPRAAELRQATPAILRGTGLGAVLGVLPGGGALLSSFAAYMLEKKIARDPGRFGRGAIEGVAAPESANNAGAQSSFIPLLTLGIPSNAVMALMMGAMLVHGVQPGPLVIQKQPELFWGIVASMWIGNLMLLVINLPLIGIWVAFLRIPYRMLFPIIILFCCIGVYSVNNSPFEVGLAALFGLVGYVLVRCGCEPAPLVMGFILGPMMEENLRRALALSRGDPLVFVQRPISLALLLIAAALLVMVLLPAIGRKRREVFVEE